jgi:hypothetical protein
MDLPAEAAGISVLAAAPMAARARRVAEWATKAPPT